MARAEPETLDAVGKALESLTLGPDPAQGGASAATSSLKRLLTYCGQKETQSLDDLLRSLVDLSQVKKIGEGTFGEAFEAGGCVIKIVPMEGDMKVNGEVQKRAEDMLGEVAIGKTLSALSSAHARDRGHGDWTDGFVALRGVGVARGRYPPGLIDKWHLWDEEFGSENDAVDAFGDDQLYMVFAFEDGGVDLERATLPTVAQVRSLLFQTVVALAVAEESVEFEHRDLHWGNILIQKGPDVPERVHARFRGIELAVETAGVQCTLIDFTLSRLQTLDGSLAFCDLAADPELFLGPRANIQADTYRRMKKITKGQWAEFTPATNAAWLHYLADTCLVHKLATVPQADKAALRGFRKRALGYTSASEAIWDDFFKGCWSTVEAAAE